ncbi:MAG TPA: phosphoglycerate dehydrogenase, partial [Catalimonadaceae bacterium]|nr:phosphoglycerate dehydrogenase [Catalimonadaceae bacterium]
MKCLIIDDVHPILIQRLEFLGIEVQYLPFISPGEVLPQIGGIHILVVRSKMRIDGSVLDRAPDLRIIARAGAGLDIIDEGEVRFRNIALVHAAEGNADAVAEHTVGMLLCLLNKINQAN